MRWQVAGVSYPSDLTDKQWQKVVRFFGRSDPRGARSKYSKRRVVEAILYRLREGCRWRALPHDFPPWDTVYDHWRRWKKRGIWQEAVAVLRAIATCTGAAFATWGTGTNAETLFRPLCFHGDEEAGIIDGKVELGGVRLFSQM